MKTFTLQFRKAFTLAALAVGLSMTISAASESNSSSTGGSPFAQGERVGYVALGLGGLNGIYGSTSVPPIYAGMDWGIQKNISAGFLVGYARSSYDYGVLNSNYNWSYTYIPIEGRVAYHFTNLDFLKNIPLDPYAALALGYSIVTVSGTNTGSASGGYVNWGLDAGARYWFKPNLAGQLELGWGLGVINLGLAYKF